MARKRVKKKKDKKVFSATAQLTNVRNFNTIKRGGIRLWLIFCDEYYNTFYMFRIFVMFFNDLLKEVNDD